MIEQPPRLPVPDLESFGELVALLPQLIWIAAGDGSRLHFLNARWLEYTGQTPDEAFADANAAIHPDDRAAAEAAWHTSLASGRAYECLMRLRRHDGAYRWFVARCLPLHDAAGAVARWFGSSTDVHDSVMAERDARLLTRLGDLPAEAVDEDDLIASATRAVAAHLEAECRVSFADGKRAALGEAVGDRWVGRSSTGDAVVDGASVVVPLLRSGRPAAALEVRADDGRQWDPREVILLKLAAQRVWHALERLRLLRGLGRSEHRLQLALESGGTAIHEWDIAEGDRLHWDRRMRELWGLPPDAPIDYEGFLASVHPDDRAMVTARVAEALDPVSGGDYHAEYRVVGADGVERWISAAAQVSFVDRRPVHLIGTAHDISDRKRGDLDRERLLDDLRTADREKDRFLATVGHELRNPLGPMRTALDLLHAQAGQLPPAVTRPLGVIDRQVAQMSRIVDDLLDAARVASGQLTLQRETTDLRGLVHDAADAARGALDGRRHTLHVDAGAVPAWALVDPVRVRQVFGNLLTNAAKYTLPGGHVWVRLTRSAAEVTVSIEDDGIGLAQEDLARVFEMFYRVPPPEGAVPAGDGLGIGLALARRLVESQGGRIEASSPGPGAGTTMRVTFPLAAVAPGTVPVATDVPRHGARVLVVDDNRDAADTLALLLGMFGCETAVAYTGGEALMRADDFRPEVILLDLQLPDISGHVVCAQLRAQVSGRAVRIVAVSGRGQAEDHSASAAAGFDAHLVKPVALEALHPLLAVR